LLLCAHAGTDRLTGTVSLYKPCSAYYDGSANNEKKKQQYKKAKLYATIVTKQPQTTQLNSPQLASTDAGLKISMCASI